MIMKKVFNSLFVIIAAMVTFAGCAKQETDAPATSETKTVQFFANSIETKTEFGTPDNGVYPTLWSAGDMVDVSVNFAQQKSSSEVECSDDFKSARFEVDLSGTEVEAPYTFYSVSPVDRLRGISSQNKRFYVEILSEQTPLPTSVDRNAQLLFAKSSTTEEMPSSVELTYHHLTAYGKFSLTNLAAESVSSIKLEAEFDIVGKWDYFVEDGSFKVRSGNGSKSITLTTSSTTDIWFACAPVDMTGKKMTLTVTTEKGNFVKVLNFPADKERKFEAGKISKFTVDMAEIEVEGSEEPEQPGETTAYYEKVTSAPTDWSGKYLLVNETAAKALSAISTTSTKYGLGTDVTISNEKIIATDALSACQVEISKATVNSDAYVMMFGGKYLTWTSGNSLNVATSESANTNWIITLSDGNAVIKNSNDNTRQIFWNPQSPRFACYNKDGQSAVQLYVLVDSNEGGSETPEEPKTLVSIAVAGQTTTYTVGDTFEFDGTVTATYDDESTADVTATATFTGYDMDAVGTQTVTVSYTEGEETKTATYTITVEEAVAPSEPTVVTIAEFLAAPVNATVLYQLTGTITNIADESWGNFTISDGVESVYIYGLTKTPQTSNDKSFASLGLKVGDKVTLVTVRGEYNEVAQGGGKTTPAYYVSHVAAPTLEVSPANITVEADVTTAVFELSCDTGYDITYPEGVVEVSEEHSNETGSSTYTVEFPANETAEPIIYVITVKADAEGFDVEKTVTITQKAASQGGGDEKVPSTTACYTLDGTIKDGNNGYDKESSITQNGISWGIVGNTDISPWRIGGKSINGVDRNVYTKTAYSSELSKIELVTGTATITWNSLTLEYSTNSDFSNSQTIVASGIGGSKTITFAPDGGFPANCYFRFKFNVTNTSGSNKYVQLSAIKFYGYEN